MHTGNKEGGKIIYQVFNGNAWFFVSNTQDMSKNIRRSVFSSQHSFLPLKDHLPCKVTYKLASFNHTSLEWKC